MSDLQTAYEALRDKDRAYTRLWAYYEGNHPLKYSSKRLYELFRKIDVSFVENWCSVVVNAAYDRIKLERFSIADRDDLTDLLNKMLKDTELDLDADDITLAALVCGESYGIAWKEDQLDDEGNITGQAVEAYYHDPCMCHLEYEPSNPRKKKFGAKWWEEEVEDEGKPEERIRLNLYYPDRLEYWISKKKPEDVQKDTDFIEFQPSETNPWKQVPIFHFRRERRKVVSELSDILTMQDAVNKLLSDMMVSAEFGAIVQRYIVSNADLSSIKNAANEHWIIPAAEKDQESTQVGQFKPTELKNFLEAMDKLAYAIGVITRTPRHYFFDQGGVPSGEALMTQESPLNKKCQRYIDRLANTWQRMAAFLLELETGEKIPVEDIDVIFASPETIQPKTQAEIRKVNVDCGIPLKTTLRREGWTEKEMDEMEDDAKADKDAASGALAAALMEQTRQYNAGTPAMPPGQGPPINQKPPAPPFAKAQK